MNARFPIHPEHQHARTHQSTRNTQTKPATQWPNISKYGFKVIFHSISSYLCYTMQNPHSLLSVRTTLFFHFFFRFPFSVSFLIEIENSRIVCVCVPSSSSQSSHSVQFSKNEIIFCWTSLTIQQTVSYIPSLHTF